jgi:hypothetical protein
MDRSIYRCIGADTDVEKCIQMYRSIYRCIRVDKDV